MKTLIFLIVFMGLAITSQAQSGTSLSDVSFEEVTISPPVFTGHKYSSEINPKTSLIDYMQKNCVCPGSAMALQKAGSEVVSFVITPDGEITEINVINSICCAIDKEVIRILKATNGMWKPASIDGNPVKMKKELCFRFSPKSENVLQDFKKIGTKHFRKATEAMFTDKKYKKAERLFNKAMLYLPYDKSTLINRGFCRYALGDIDGAFNDWNRLKDLGGLNMTSSYAQNLKELEGYEALVALLK